MKNFIYILTIGGLLWLFFNPKGIFAYNTLNNKIQKQKKRLEEYKKTEREFLKKQDAFIKCLDKGNISECKKKFYPALFKRNVKEKGTERVKF